MKKRIISLVTALVLCFALASMCFTASACGSYPQLTEKMFGRRCTATIAIGTKYAQASSYYEVTADYIYARADYCYKNSSGKVCHVTATNDATGINSISAKTASVSGTYLGGKGEHQFYKGDTSWKPATFIGNWKIR